MLTDLAMMVYCLARLVWALIDGGACYTGLAGRRLWKAWERRHAGIR